MSDTEAKTRPASQRKLRKLRKEGQVPQTTESTGYLGVVIGLLALLGSAPIAFAALLSLFDETFVAIETPFEDVLPDAPGLIGRPLGLILGPVVGAAVAAAVLGALVFNNGIVFAAKAVAPQVTRVSPLSGLKRIYGRRGWIETAMSLVRLGLWFAILLASAFLLLPRIVDATNCGVPCQAGTGARMAVTVLLGAVVTMLLAMAAEVAIQRGLFLHEQQMTETEVKQERKESFGDPGIRRERQRRAREAPPNPAAAGADKANIWIFHEDRALGIRYRPEDEPIPRVAARLEGQEAIRVRKAVTRSKTPLVENAVIVSGCGGVGPGDPIPSHLYETFATLLRKHYM